MILEFLRHNFDERYDFGVFVTNKILPKLPNGKFDKIEAMKIIEDMSRPQEKVQP